MPSVTIAIYILVSFPSLQPPKSTAFQCYVREGEDDREFVKQNTVVAGETDSIEFSGPSIGEEDGLGSRCLLLNPSLSSSHYKILPVIILPFTTHLPARWFCSLHLFISSLDRLKRSSTSSLLRLPQLSACKRAMHWARRSGRRRLRLPFVLMSATKST